MSERFRWVLALTSGLLLGLAFPPFPFPWLAWVAYLPLIGALRNCEWRTAAALASSTHMIAYAIAGYWVVVHPDLFTRASSAAGMVWLASVAALPWIASTVNQRKDGTLSAAWLIGVSGIMEWLQLHTELGFPWPALGHTQSEFEPFNQLAEIAGVPGLSIWVLGINVGLYSVLRIRSRRSWGLALGVVGLIVGPALLGSYLLDEANTTEDSRTDEIRILAIQPSISLEHWLDPTSSRRIESLVDLTETALANSRLEEAGHDLIVWPETAIPPTNLGEPIPLGTLRDQVARWQIPVLSGAIEVVAGSEPNSPYRNAAFLIDPQSPVVQSYRKQRLVPFAEYVPYSTRFSFLRRLAVPSGGVWGYTPGTRDGLFQLRPRWSESRMLASIKSAPARSATIQSASIQSTPREFGAKHIGVLICFESSFGYLAGRLARGGADIIVVLTQDGWWGKSFGYQQHLAFNRLRAIETRLPLAQVSATGITALISPSGRVVSKMGWMESGSSTWSVATRQLASTDTFYTRFGDWPGPLCAVFTAFLILIRVHRRKRARNRTWN